MSVPAIRSLRRFRPAAAVLAAALGCALFATSAAAQEPTVRDGVVAFGEDERVRSGEVVEGDVVVLGGHLEIEEGARVTGDVMAMGDAVIAGAVDGAAFISGSLELDETATIGEDLTVLGRLDRADGSEVGGRVTSGAEGLGVGRGPRLARGPRWYGSGVVSLIAMTLLAAVFAALAVAVGPDAIARVGSAAAARPAPTFAVGCLAWIVAVPLFVALLATVVGAVILPIVYGAMVLVGWVVLGDLVGRRLMPGSGRGLRAAIGTGLITFVANLPFLTSGAVICAVLFFLVLLISWPMGAIVLTLFGTRQWPDEPHLVPGAAGPPPLPPRGGETPMPAPLLPVGEAGDAVPFAPQAPPAPAAPAAPAAPSLVPAPPTTPAEPASREAASDAEEAAAPPSDIPVWPVPPEVHAEAVLDLNLQRIPGISPVYAYLLREAGVADLQALISASPEQIAEITSVPGVMPVSAETAGQWIRAGRELLGLD
jgi:predicted flap endonuclease-1-like 5' DNA nuclease/cytoskeletal protein CcmA (bactofilin family)